MQQHIKRFIYHDQMEFIPGIQVGSTSEKSINVISHTKIIRNKNSMITSIDTEKVFEKLITFSW